MYILASFVKDKVSIGAWIYLWAFYFVPLISISVFVPVPYCLDDCGFVVEPEVRQFGSSSSSSLYNLQLFFILCGQLLACHLAGSHQCGVNWFDFLLIGSWNWSMHIWFITSNKPLMQRLEHHRWPLYLGEAKDPAEMILLESVDSPTFIYSTSTWFPVYSKY